MSTEATAGVAQESSGDQRVAVLLAMAMFVLVVDTSLMNVSISAVVRDLDTTASGVQSAIALEALVSAAFILIGSKIGDLIGCKRAYVLGLIGYAIGALSMTLSQTLLPIVIFWAVIGGIGASLLLPSMQSLIHGNFEGAMQRKAYALVGAAAAIAAAVGLLAAGVAVLLPIVPRAHSGWWMVVPLLIAGCGLGLLVSQLNNYTLAPIEEERVSEAAGVNSAGGSFGLSFGLAFAGAIMLASLSLVFTQKANDSTVLTPAQKDKVATQLQKNAEVMTNTHLEHLLAGQPEAVKAEIVRINTDSRPIALQIALLVPLLAALVGLANGFRMIRLPDPEPSSAAEG